MTVKMVATESIDDSALISSTIAEDDADVWDESTDYPFSDPDNPEEVMVTTGYHKIYRAVAPSGPSYGGAIDPTTDTTNQAWVEIRSTNRWRVFDEYVGDPAVQSESASWTIQSASIVDSVVLIGVSASTVSIQVYDSEDTLVYSLEDQSLQDESGVANAYDYFFSPIIRYRNFAITDIPPYYGAKVIITLNAEGDTVSLGQLAIGKKDELGEAVGQVSLSIDDFSRKERDPYFGRVKLQEAAFASLLPVSFVAPVSKSNYLDFLLSDRRASLTAFVVDGPTMDNEFIIYGFYKTYQIVVYAGKSKLEVTIELESIT